MAERRSRYLLSLTSSLGLMLMSTIMVVSPVRSAAREECDLVVMLFRVAKIRSG